MFTRLFGETDEQQINYLQTRVIITLFSIVASILLTVFIGSSATGIFALVMLFAWGWGAVKALFGVASIGIIFSGNIFIGSAIFVFYVLFAYFSGIIFAVIGIARYVYLMIRHAKERA
ncbi:hypothetical protein [Evtepia sp.]|uniref:hypothetical protein n=1 Tax=Evtepia sp. TaxID=2773933 RepID=UPI003F16D691